MQAPAPLQAAEAPAGGTAQAADASVSPVAADHRILVMLKLAPEHYRPNADYGAGGYGDASAAAARRRLAERLARGQGLILGENWPMPVLGVDCVVMIVPDGVSPAATADRMSHQPGVAWSQPMNEFVTQASAPAAPGHNDRLFPAQPAARRWRLAELHQIATGRGVKVAVIDSRIDADHPDLRGQVAASRNFVDGAVPPPENHGTGVAGIIGARADNSIGIAGVAPGARLLGLRACWQQSEGGARTVCDSLSLAKALTAALESGADIINMSLTGPRDTLIARLVEVGLRRGTAVVAAVDPRSQTSFPASIPGVIAVAQEGFSVNHLGVYNAPGRDIPTTEPGGRWYLVSGSSYAAAHVTGLLALLHELSPGKPPVRYLVSSMQGGGSIDACGSLLRATRRPGVRCATKP